MVDLKIHNDGKEKYQSWEVWIDGLDIETGYGSTEKEAIAEFINIITNHSEYINAIVTDLKLNKFNTLKVNFDGSEIIKEK